MPFNRPEAEQLIRDAIARRAAEETILIPIDEPDVPIWDVDPNEWKLYVMQRRNSCRLGGDEYVAIHPETHEVRFLSIHMGGLRELFRCHQGVTHRRLLRCQ